MNKTILPLLLVSALALSGCGKKKEEAPAQATPAQQPAATSPGAVDQAKQVAADVAAQAKKAGEQVVEQGKQVAAQTTEQAKAAAAQVTEQAKTAATQVTEQAKTAVTQAKDEAKSLVDSFKKPAGTDAAAPLDFAALTSKVTESAKSLLSDPSVTAPVKEQLTKLADSVLGNQDGVAAAALNKIVALKPSEEQMGLVKELQSNLGVLALGRNFDVNDPASGGAVKQTIAAIQAKDTASIVSGLQKLGTTAKLTDAQKDIVGNLVGSYGGKLAGITDSVNKASDALKGFGF